MEKAVSFWQNNQYLKLLFLQNIAINLFIYSKHVFEYLNLCIFVHQTDLQIDI